MFLYPSDLPCSLARGVALERLFALLRVYFFPLHDLSCSLSPAWEIGQLRKRPLIKRSSLGSPSVGHFRQRLECLSPENIRKGGACELQRPIVSRNGPGVLSVDTAPRSPAWAHNPWLNNCKVVAQRLLKDARTQQVAGGLVAAFNNHGPAHFPRGNDKGAINIEAFLPALEYRT